VWLCAEPCHQEFTALQRSLGVLKPGQATDQPRFDRVGRNAALSQGALAQLILAVRAGRGPGSEAERYLDRVSRDVTDLAAKVARETGERVPLPDPLADDGAPA
jgi:hypothetical protein